ncbi:hypothetical protein D3C80_2161120 [compost metagenome]
MPHQLRIRQLRQQLEGRSLEAFQRVRGGRFVETGVLQGATHQDMAVSARNRIAPLGQHHGWQEVRGALE